VVALGSPPSSNARLALGRTTLANCSTHPRSCEELACRPPVSGPTISELDRSGIGVVHGDRQASSGRQFRSRSRLLDEGRATAVRPTGGPTASDGLLISGNAIREPCRGALFFDHRYALERKRADISGCLLDDERVSPLPPTNNSAPT